jgi:hypothetical protein
MFRSYKEFFSQKITSKPEIMISLDEYREHVYVNLSGMVLKHDPIGRDALKKTFDVNQIRRKMEEISYPHTEAFIISIQNGNPSKIIKQIENLDMWVYKNSVQTDVVQFLEGIFLTYQSNIIKKTIHPNDIDKAILTFVEKSRTVLGEMTSRIESIIDKIPWDNHPIYIEALVPENDWVADTARVHIGEFYKSNFDIKKTDKGLKIENIVFNEMPEKIIDQMKNLIARLKESPEIKKILSLYMSQPSKNRTLFERKKRDVSLGIKAVIPQGTMLTNLPYSEGDDVWKVRIDDEGLIRNLQEGNIIGYNLIEDANIRWIELVRSGNEK